MIFKRNRFLLCVLFGVASCAPAPRFYLQYRNQLTRFDVDQVLTKNPLGPSENTKAVSLGEGQGVSHHVVQVRDREVPHVHKNHDLTVVLVRGKGSMVIDKQRIDLRVGDAAFIPRAVAHYFVNTSSAPSAGFVIFSPPFDGKDTVPVKE